MKILLVAATALTMSGAALAYQTHAGHDATVMHSTVTIDPTVALTPPATWTDVERAMWEQHMATLPVGWTAEQRTAYRQIMGLPPASWTAEQRALYSQHMATLPTAWTVQQRALYQQQVAAFRTPWLGVSQTAAATTGGTTLAMAPISGRIVQPSNANPERDQRGIAVISDPAVVPDGYNGFSGTGMGGPLVDPATGETIEGADRSYPACTATVTDNCIQLYERGVRASLASWNRTTGGFTGVGGPIEEGNDNTVEDDLLDVDVKPDGTIDVDGDLDGDGDNDLE